MRATFIPSSLTNGIATIIYKDTEDNTTIGLNIEYKDFGKKIWNNKEIPTGKFTLSILDPDSKISKSIKGIETFPEILTSTLTIGCDVQNNVMKYTCSLPLKGFGEIDINASSQLITPIVFEMPVITAENSYVMDPSDPAKIFDQKMMDEVQTGAIKHVYGLAKRNDALAQILEKLGLPMEALDAYINGSEVTKQ